MTLLQSLLLLHQRQPCFSLRNDTFDRGFWNVQRDADAGGEASRALRQQGLQEVGSSSSQRKEWQLQCAFVRAHMERTLPRGAVAGAQ